MGPPVDVLVTSHGQQRAGVIRRLVTVSRSLSQTEALLFDASSVLIGPSRRARCCVAQRDGEGAAWALRFDTAGIDCPDPALACVSGTVRTQLWPVCPALSGPSSRLCVRHCPDPALAGVSGTVRAQLWPVCPALSGPSSALCVRHCPGPAPSLLPVRPADRSAADRRTGGPADRPAAVHRQQRSGGG